MKVLVIEDEGGIRTLVRIVAKTTGHDLVEASTGEEGLSLAATESPELVLLDLRLPDIDGFEVLRRVRTAAPPAAKIVIMSAHSSGDARARALSEGCDGFIVKPFRLEELLEWFEGAEADGHQETEAQ
jgi:two-component system, OmpR family, KDP operon response regulator KdpE